MRRYDGERNVPVIGDDTKRSHSLLNVFEGVLRSVRGEDRVQAAIRAAHRVVVEGLARLNSQIPALSRAGDMVPYAQRRQWNHFWLVDPLDGEEAFASGAGDFSVNIA